jgi:6-phosphogluconolactonase
MMKEQGEQAMKQWVRRLGSAAALGILSFSTGCGSFFVYPGSSGSGSSATGDYVYVANSTTGTLAGYAIGTGTLTAASGSPYVLGFSPTAVAVNPADSIVFVAGTNAGNGFIAAYSIGSGGALTLLVSNSVGLADEVSMDISPDGKWLLGLDANGLTVDEYQINSSTGQLTLATGASYTVSGATVVPRGLRVAPNGNYIFAAIGTAGDLVFPFNTSTGVLSAPLTLALGSGVSDNALAVSPNSSYLYIARSGTAAGLAVYTIGSGGALNSVSGSPFAAGSQPFSVVVNNAGTDVYVANQLDSTISGYSVASNGTVTALSGSPYGNGSQVTVLAADRTGNYLLAASRTGSPDLTLYSFDSAISGKLDFATSTSTGADPTGPIAMATTH